MLLSQANNSDFGHTAETFQQEPLARLQAISTGRSVVHVSTVGVTEVIDVSGQVQQRLPAFQRGYLIQRVALHNNLTPAMRFYGWVDFVAVAVAALTIIDAVLRRWKFKRLVQTTPRNRV